MAKGSGSTRSSGPKAPMTWREAMDAPPSDRLAFVISHIDTRYGGFEPDSQAVLAFDALSDSDRDEMLRRTGFSGMVEDDTFYGDTAMISTAVKMERDWMWGQVDTYTWDNDPDDDYGFYIGYSDGTVISTRDYGERHKFKRKGAAWIVGNGLMGGFYWASGAGKESMKDFNGFTEWKNGQKVR